MLVSAVSVAERSEFVLVSRSGKIFFPARIAQCAVKTRPRAAAVLFLYRVAASVFFDFAAGASKDVTSCVIVACNG